METQQVLDNLLTGVIVLDRQLQVLYVNGAAESLLGLSRQRLQDQPLPELLAGRLDPARLQQVLASGQGFIDTDCNLGTLDLELSVSLLDGAPKRLLLELTPIDQLKRLSLEAFQAIQQQASQELVRGLAHEIKNPLGGMRGAAQLLALELPAEQKEYTDLILGQVDRLAALVDRLLGPRQAPRRVRQNLHQILEKVVQLVRLEAPKGIELVRDYDPSLPEPICDGDQLQQAVLNIMQNAVQALGSQGRIRLRSRVESGVTLQGVRHKLAARIDIEDNGPGIPAPIRETLFYPLVTGRPEGSGLGLSISQSLISLHGGRIEVDSRPGLTRFSIYLPLEDAL
ncbi:nitrogen regulation protein NR(II) [Gallaecimonas sp. GXIMD4217]|uniref:nitrogen regulation protein NR(II) n=1 Tax=Gallaecimonas sp. GXIMD4217 TaxID=3131927 RepID=UPI00311AEA8A